MTEWTVVSYKDEGNTMPRMKRLETRTSEVFLTRLPTGWSVTLRIKNLAHPKDRPLTRNIAYYEGTPDDTWESVEKKALKDARAYVLETRFLLAMALHELQEA